MLCIYVRDSNDKIESIFFCKKKSKNNNMAGIANIVGFSNIINKAGKTVDIETYCRGKIIGFYFRLKNLI